MEKVLQILIVFVLLMLVIGYSFYSREKKFRAYYFVRQTALPLPGSPYWDLLFVSFLPEGEDSLAADPENQLLFRGRQNISRDEGPREQDAAGVERMGHNGQAGGLEISDETTGERVAFVALEESVDALLFDPVGRLLFCCSAAGALSIIRQVDRESYKTVQHLVIPGGCSEMALDVKTGRLYLQSGQRVLLYERE